MKQIELKNYSRTDIASFLVVLVLSTLLLGAMLIGIIVEHWENRSERVFFLCLSILALVPSIYLFCFFIIDSRKRVLITEDEILYYSGKNLIRTVKKDEIIAYGCYSANDKYHSSSIFFCFAPIQEITEFAQRNWHRRKRIYRKKQLEELEGSPTGIWTLQMSIYVYSDRFLRKQKRNVIYVSRTTKEEVHAICQLWQRKPMLLGSMALYTPWRYL